MKRLFALLVAVTMCLTAQFCCAQEQIQYAFDHESQVYAVGEEATVTITVSEGNAPVAGGTLSVKLTNDGRDELESLSFNLAENNPVTVKAKLEFPGFLQILATARSTDEKKNVSKLAGAAFDPEKIEPGIEKPADFDEFWSKGQAEVRALPLDFQQEKIESLCNEKHDVYSVSFATVNDRRVYGWLCIPKQGEAPFPALVNVPGAGPGTGPLTLLADEGFATLAMNVFPYPVSLDNAERQKQYDEYNKSLGVRYCYLDGENRDKYFFRAAYLGIDRAVDWFAEQDYVDANRIGYFGTSQGGASALILGGLNSHFCEILSSVPALCDHNGYEKGRSPGWPRIVDFFKQSKEAQEAVPYLDGVNFARRIKVPVTVTVGFIDGVCSPSSVYAAYNVIPSEGKRILHETQLGHQNGKQYEAAFAEIKKNVKEKNAR